MTFGEDEETMTPATVPDLRGKMFRAKRLMSDAEAREFLHNQKIAHVGMVDGNGWPYVVPLVYIYEGGDYVYLHTGAHQGHFLTNLQRDSRLCVEVSDMGPLHKGKRYACDSALVYTSIIVFGCLGRRAFSFTIEKRKHGFSTAFWPSTVMRLGCSNLVIHCSARSSGMNRRTKF
jgi:nitroimidazol reductase NimA-like FMN-containing flavoprotein (pyridoxamine 5'-phosphate oxidase superfamily)